MLGQTPSWGLLFLTDAPRNLEFYHPKKTPLVSCFFLVSRIAKIVIWGRRVLCTPQLLYVFEIFMVSLDPTIVPTLKHSCQSSATCYISDFQGLRRISGPSAIFDIAWEAWRSTYIQSEAAASHTLLCNLCFLLYHKESQFCKVSNHSFLSCLWPDIINTDSTALGIIW